MKISPAIITILGFGPEYALAFGSFASPRTENPSRAEETFFLHLLDDIGTIGGFV